MDGQKKCVGKSDNAATIMSLTSKTARKIVGLIVLIDILKTLLVVEYDIVYGA